METASGGGFLAPRSFAVPLDQRAVGGKLRVALAGTALGPGAVRREVPRLPVVPPHELEQLAHRVPVARRPRRDRPPPPPPHGARATTRPAGEYARPAPGG